MSVEHFHEKEEAYAAWLEANTGGFVFNHFGSRHGNVTVVHRASCPFLRRQRDEGRRTQIEKICSSELDRLIAVVDELRADAGGWKRCGKCDPN